MTITRIIDLILRSDVSHPSKRMRNPIGCYALNIRMLNNVINNRQARIQTDYLSESELVFIPKYARKAAGGRFTA